MANSEILKRSAIDPEAIDDKQFTASLLQEMVRTGLADQTFADFFQNQLLELLNSQLKEATNNESSSVPVELADELMDGIAYCIDTALKLSPALEDSASMLHGQSVQSLYELGKEQLDAHCKACIALLSRARATRLKTVNQGYRLVLDVTFPDFIRSWKTNPFPHDFEVITEYPLAAEQIESGIVGVHKRLSALALENRFCARYPQETVESLLTGYADAHRVTSTDAYVNLFTLCLQNLLLNKLMGRNSLLLTEDDRTQLEQKLHPLSPGQRAELIRYTAELFIKENALEYPKLEDYIRQAALDFANLLNSADGTLRELSVVTPAARSLVHTDGERLEDDAFALVAEEVMLAETAKEKVQILQSELRSLEDLTDLLASGSIFEDEFEQLFTLFDPVTLAMLLSVSPVTITGQTLAIQTDLEWQTALVSCLNQMEEQQKAEILSIYHAAME